MALYFVDNNRFITYTTEGSTWDGITHSHNITHGPIYENSGRKIAFDLKQGLAGKVRERIKPLIVMNIRKSVDYDETIDLDSLLPIYIIPLIKKVAQKKSINFFQNTQEVVGIMEVTMKLRFLLKTAKDDIFLGSSALVGLDDSFESVTNRVAEALASAYILILKK